MKQKIIITFVAIFVSFRIMADNTILVGTIDVNATVSESGGAVVTIPIDVPAGINGMQPNLALVYNSQGGLGTCGWGWSLSGLSSISRTGSTPYYDNTVRGVMLDSLDNLRLDSQRLFLESGQNLAAGAVYRTEVESWSKITFKTASTGFEVKTKDGVTAIYGDSYLSRLAYTPTSGVNALAWNISKVTDACGNYMTYTYTTSYYPGESYITKIAYTGNTLTVSPTKEVTFEYDNLLYPHTFYENGSAFASRKILRRINVRSNNQELWHYELTYNTDSVHYKLGTVTKVAANGNSYPPVELTWSTEQAGSLEATTLTKPSSMTTMPEECIYGDFNGDGKTDYFTYTVGSNAYRLYINTSTTVSSSFSPYNYTFPGTVQSVQTCDLEGDGKEDLIICYKSSSTYYVYSYGWNGSSLYSKSFLQSGNNSFVDKMLIGDFDGDSKQEVLFLFIGYNILYDLNESIVPVTGIADWNDFLVSPKSKAENSHLIDFNGNGKTDIFMVGNDSIYAYEYNPNNQSFYTICRMPVANANLYNNDYSRLQFGDFNGDGKTDLVFSQKHLMGNTIPDWRGHILLSDGTKFIPSNVVYSGEYCFASDFNNDGLSDIAFCVFETNTWTVHIGLNKGNTFEYRSRILGQVSQSGISQGKVAFFDVYGDGRGEFLHYKKNSSGSSATLLCLRIFTNHPLLLTKVTDGNGLERNFTYRPVSDPYVYTSSFSATEQVLPLKSALHVVSSLTAPYTSLHYTYSDGRIHRKGKGFLGFMERTVTDSLNLCVTTQTNAMDGTYYFLKPSYTTINHTNGLALSRTDVTMANKTYGPKRFWPYVTRSISRDFLTTLSSTTENEYDNYGNLTRQSTTTGNYETLSTYRYTKANSAQEYPNRVRHSMSRSRLGTEWSDSIWTDYKYDAKGRLIHQVQDSLSTTYRGTMLSSHFKYDTYGHVIRTVTKDSLQTRTSSVTYANDYPYSPATSTDVLGMTTTYYNNTQKGLLDSIADGADRRTRYQYDAFGRLWCTTLPDGSETTTSLQRVTNVNGACYSVSTVATNTPSVTTWYNVSGMPILQREAGFNNQDIFTVTRYKSDGRVERVSEPFYENSPAAALSNTLTPANATVYTYDTYGRTSAIQSPVGTTSYTYSNRTTTVTTPEGKYRIIKKASGLDSLKILDPNGTTSPSRRISYAYYPTGQVKTITPQGSTAIQLSYDRRGRRTKLVDPDAGTVIDRYNAFGQLLSHRQDIHSGNVETTYGYGVTTGRLLTETTHGTPTRTKTYTYSSTFKDQPTKISYSGSNYVAYSYDILGRMTQTQKVIGGETITDSYTYDPDDYGLLTSHTSGGNVTEYFTYDDYGNLVSTSLSPTGTSLWELLEVNARGQVVREKKSGITTTYSYDNAGRVTSIVAPGIVDLHYQYDGAGNTHYKYDGINYIETTYSYDSKNRLTGWEVEKTYDQSSYRSFAMSYDNTTGNILTKTDLGTSAAFSYNHTTKPHALTGVLNYPDTCSLVTTTYTDFGKVQYIARSGLAYSIDYLPDGARGKSTWTSVDRTITRYYGDGSEKVYDTYGAERTISYLSCGGFVIEDWVLPSGLVDGRAGGSSDRDSLRASPPPSGPNPQPVSTSVLHGYYDAQGSLIALVTTGGTVVRRYAYDPWGRRVLPSDWTQPDTQADTYHINRGYTMHEHLDDFGLINMNGRVFDPLTAQFLSPDNYIQSDGNWLNYNRYAYCLNNPLKYTDPSGEIVWFIPVLICAAIGAYTGASIQSGTAAFWNWKSDSWKGAIAGAIVGATIGYGVASAIGASGIVASAGETIGVDAAGTVSSILNSGTVNITTNVITGGDWDSAWKAGVVGMVTGAWNVSGGFGMVKGLGAKTDIGKLTAKLGYQMIGTTMGSIGDNWVKGNNLFSKVVVGVGPINFTIGKGQKLLQWQNNKGNILVNTIGLGNCLFGGKVDFDWRNLSINYSGGVVDAFVPDSYSSGFGAHAIIGNKNLYGVIGHELHHLWQSRAYGDNYVLNYGLQGIDAFLNTGLLSSIISNDNYFERQAYGAYWW